MIDGVKLLSSFLSTCLSQIFPFLPSSFYTYNSHPPQRRLMIAYLSSLRSGLGERGVGEADTERTMGSLVAILTGI